MLPLAWSRNHAQQDCKYTKTVNQSGGEIVSSTTNYDCNTPPKVIIKEVPKVVYKTVQPTTRVISTRVVSSTPVYHNPPQQNNNLIGQILGSVINYNNRVCDRKCKYRWSICWVLKEERLQTSTTWGERMVL